MGQARACCQFGSVRVKATTNNSEREKYIFWGEKNASTLTVPVSAVGQLVTAPAAKPQSARPPAAFVAEPPAPFELDHRLEVEPS